MVRLRATPARPRAGRTVRLDARRSADPDGKLRGFRWDLDGDGDFDDAQGAVVKTSFADPGPAAVAARADDDGGRAAIGRLTVRVRRGAELPPPRALLRKARRARPGQAKLNRGYRGWQRRGTAFGTKPATTTTLDDALNLEGGIGGSLGSVPLTDEPGGRFFADSLRERSLRGQSPRRPARPPPANSSHP